MPRYYVKNPEGKWNVYSTIVNNVLLDNWLEFNDFVDAMLLYSETVKNRKKELETLLTDNPVLNVMSYEEYMDEIKLYHGEEEGDKE